MRAVDRDQALAELPVAYATALRLEAAGAERALIAQALGIDVEGVRPLLALAEAKLDRLLDGDAPFAAAERGDAGEGSHDG